MQSRNERMFLVTMLVMNHAGTRQKLENNIFQAAGVAQKYNCALRRLDYQQEQGLFQQAMLGEIVHCLRHLFQIEYLCPARVASAFSGLQFCLNIHQKIDLGSGS